MMTKNGCCSIAKYVFSPQFYYLYLKFNVRIVCLTARFFPGLIMTDGDTKKKGDLVAETRKMHRVLVILCQMNLKLDPNV